VELAGARMSINPFDENAMEAAMRQKKAVWQPRLLQ